MVLPSKITAQGWALAPIAVATRPQGAPLTVILGGKRMPGTEDGPGPLQARPSTQRYGGDRRPAEAGQPGLAAAARPAGLPPEGARHGRRPGVGQQPNQLPRLVQAVVPVSVTHPHSMTSRPLPASGPSARRLACRRRALEAVEKVVTGAEPRHRT